MNHLVPGGVLSETSGGHWRQKQQLKIHELPCFLHSGYLQVMERLWIQVAVPDRHGDIASGQVVNLHVAVLRRRRFHHRFLPEGRKVENRQLSRIFTQ